MKYTPTQEQFQVVIDNLEKALKYAKKNTAVDMMSVDIAHSKKEACGTPMCHGGWYFLVTTKGAGYGSYTIGANLMAEHLGFYDEYYLRKWAYSNPDIWGNKNGEDMFCSPYAFGDNYEITLKDIVDHWKGVKERAALL